MRGAGRSCTIDARDGSGGLAPPRTGVRQIAMDIGRPANARCLSGAATRARYCLFRHLGRLLDALSQPSVSNPVILSGDVHSFWLNDVYRQSQDQTGPVVANEIVTSCLASRSGPEALFATAKRLNPHVRFMDNNHSGYALIDLTSNALDVRFRAVSSIANRHAECSTLLTARLQAGDRAFKLSGDVV